MRYIKINFHIINILLIIFYLYPGSIFGCIFYNDCYLMDQQCCSSPRAIIWISDENIPSLRNVEKAGGKPLHKLCLYKKEI